MFDLRKELLPVCIFLVCIAMALGFALIGLLAQDTYEPCLTTKQGRTITQEMHERLTPAQREDMLAC